MDFNTVYHTYRLVPFIKMRLLVLFFLIFGFQISSFSSQKSKIKILFIGNSYTYRNHMPIIFSKIAKSNGKNVEVNWCVKGKTSFYRHSLRKQVYKAISWKKWDYVVLQGSSRDMLKDSLTYHEKTMPGLNRMIDSIQKNHDKTKLVFYMTWSYRKGYKKLSDSNTHFKMIRRISSKYKEIAEKYQSKLSPVGLIWEKLYFKHNIKNLYQPDNAHPSKLGSFVTACSFFSTIFNEPVKQTPADYISIPKQNRIKKLVWESFIEFNK